MQQQDTLVLCAAKSQEIDPQESSEQKAPEKLQSPCILENKDVEFEVEGKLIAANKGTLCILSPVFNIMLKGDFKEKGLSTIPLPDKGYNDFVEFVEVTHLHKNITSANVYDILPLMHEYRCDVLLEKCEQVLLKERTTLQLYVLAGSYNLEALYKKCLEDLAEEDYFRLTKNEKSAYDSLEKQAKIDFLEALIKRQLKAKDFYLRPYFGK